LRGCNNLPVARRFERDDLEFARAVTFFDAIFAFAVTLLITTIDDFSAEAWSSLDALWDKNGDSLTAFAISFVVVVSFWRSNHQQVTGFVALDERLITLNCAVMFGVVLIPFATEAMGKQGSLPLPVAVYAVILSATYVMQFVVVLVANRRGLTVQQIDGKEKVWAVVYAAALPVVFLGSIPLAYAFGTAVAERSWLSLLLLYPVLGYLENRNRTRAKPTAEVAAEPVGQGPRTDPGGQPGPG